MKQGNMTILASVLTIALVAAGVGMGTLAYFTDTETSDGCFTAGTIDLALTGSFDFYDVKPSEELAEFAITFENVGQNPGILTMSLSYVENDKADDDEPGFEFSAYNDGGMEMTADEFASLVYISAIHYQYWEPAIGYVGAYKDDMPNIIAMDINGDGKVSLYEYKECSPVSYGDDPFPTTAKITYTITLHLGDSLNPFEAGGAILTGAMDNRPQADGILVTFTGDLKQIGAP